MTARRIGSSPGKCFARPGFERSRPPGGTKRSPSRPSAGLTSSSSTCGYPTWRERTSHASFAAARKLDGYRSSRSARRPWPGAATGSWRRISTAICKSRSTSERFPSRCAATAGRTVSEALGSPAGCTGPPCQHPPETPADMVGRHVSAFHSSLRNLDGRSQACEHRHVQVVDDAIRGGREAGEKMRTLLTGGALGALVLALAGCGASSVTSGDKATQRRVDLYEISQLERSFHEAISKKRIDQMANLFAPN